MSIWQQAGAAVGIGAARVEIALDQPAAGWGEALCGTVRLTGGQVPQEVREVKATLVEHFTTVIMVGKTPVTQHHYLVHSATVLDGRFTVQPGDTREYRFDLQAPWGAMLARHWFIGAEAAIGGGVDARATADFELLPPAQFRYLAELLGEMARMPVRRWANRGSSLRAELLPEGEAVRVLDGVALELTHLGDTVAARVEVNPQERSVGDVVRSLVRADRTSTVLRIPAAEPDAARAGFETVLRPYLDALRHLPIPAAAPDPSPRDLPVTAAPPAPEADG